MTKQALHEKWSDSNIWTEISRNSWVERHANIGEREVMRTQNAAHLMQTIRDEFMKNSTDKEIIETLKEGLKQLRQEVYLSEPIDKKEQYAAIDAAEEWLKGIEEGNASSDNQ